MVADQDSGSALNGTACAIGYCPGIQSWYNQWIAPDPTRADRGRRADAPRLRARGDLGRLRRRAGRARHRHVQGRRAVLLRRHVPVPQRLGAARARRSTATRATTPRRTPTSTPAPGCRHGAGVTLVAGHDGGVNTQTLAADGELDPDEWGRGANLGFHTLLPYDAQVAKDGTIWAGPAGQRRAEDRARRQAVHDLRRRRRVQRGRPGQQRHRLRVDAAERDRQDDRRRPHVERRRRRRRTPTSSSTRS